MRLPQSFRQSRLFSPAALARIASLGAAFAILSLSPMHTVFGSSRPTPRGAPMSLTFSSPSFTNGGTIPKKFTCDGADLSPQLSWTEAPAGTKAFALLVDDPDAPVGNWNHWTMWNMPATLRGLSEGVSKETRFSDGTEQGKNDFHKTGYNGPCPPPGKPHRYFFKLFALDAKLDLKANSGNKDLEAAMKTHILAQSEWMGTYGR